MSKIFVVDTNVLLHDPKSLFAFEDNEVVIPLVVLDELDRKKSGSDEVARHARAVIRSLDEMRELGNINNGVLTEKGGTIRVELGFQDCCPSGLDNSRPDNKIISVVLGLREKFPQTTVKLITKDINLRVKCDALGVAVEDYLAEYLVDNVDEIYTGTSEIYVEPATINEFYKNGFVDAASLGQFYPNQYVCMMSNINPAQSALARFKKGQLVELHGPKSAFGISPKNREQIYAMDALFDPDIKLVTMMGKSGCGKTLIAIASALAQVIEEKRYKKVIISRPTVNLSKTSDIGFLPGDKDEKLHLWLQGFMDNLEYIFSDKGTDYIDLYLQKRIIEMEAMNYIRGRSIPNSFILVDEAQNLTLHEVRSLVTRVSEGTKCVLFGDIFQCDNSYVSNVDNGLSCLVEKFKGYDIFGHVSFKKGERSDLASLAAEILR